MNDISFRVDEKNKVVICKLTNCRDIAYDRIVKYTKEIPIYCETEIPNVFTGIARCAPEDTFDIEYGKELALTRAKAKRGKAINTAIYKYIKRTQKGIKDLERYGVHKVPEVTFE